MSHGRPKGLLSNCSLITDAALGTGLDGWAAAAVELYSKEFAPKRGEQGPRESLESQPEGPQIDIRHSRIPGRKYLT